MRKRAKRQSGAAARKAKWNTVPPQSIDKPKRWRDGMSLGWLLVSIVRRC
jgi:hypothetical protein